MQKREYNLISVVVAFITAGGSRAKRALMARDSRGLSPWRSILSLREQAPRNQPRPAATADRQGHLHGAQFMKEEFGARIRFAKNEENDEGERVLRQKSCRNCKRCEFLLYSWRRWKEEEEDEGEAIGVTGKLRGELLVSY